MPLNGQRKQYLRIDYQKKSVFLPEILKIMQEILRKTG
jgi:hypothetical protein